MKLVKLTKSPLPKGVTITSADDYRSGVVFDLLVTDCYNKCYICEDKGITGINVEHRIAREGVAELQFCWENLLLSCTHCNKAKRKEYNNILDCTKVDPEEYIKLSMLPYPKENVVVGQIQDTPEAGQTASLLERVYNGKSTTMLALESENLKSKIFDELVSFQKKLKKYFQTTNPDRKNAYKDSIIDMIECSAPFAAFKRKIICDNRTYFHEFGDHLK